MHDIKTGWMKKVVVTDKLMVVVLIVLALVTEEVGAGSISKSD